MHSVCLKSAFAFLIVSAVIVRADIPPADDERIVTRTFGIANADADPGKAIIACEFHPGSDSPVIAYRMRNSTRSSLLGYKFDRVKLYWAKASDWPTLKADHGIPDGPPSGTLGEGYGKGWEAQGEGSKGNWKVGGALLTRIGGDVETGQSIVKNTDPLVTEELIYTLTALDQGGTAALTLKTSLYSDGRQPKAVEYPLSASGIDDLTPARRSASASVTADGRELRLTTAQGGVAAIVLYGAGGKRLWAARRVLSANEAQGIAMPRLSPGSYFVSVRGLGWSQAFPLHF